MEAPKALYAKSPVVKDAFGEIRVTLPPNASVSALVEVVTFVLAVQVVLASSIALVTAELSVTEED